MCEHTRLPDYLTADGKYDFTPLFSSCRELFSKSDYVVANLETPIAGEALKYSYKDYNFNTPEAVLDAISAAGIHMVTTANNHVLDRGIAGIDNTIKNLEAAGLDHTGTTFSGCEPQPLIKEINGFKIGFLSYTYGTEACYNGVYLKGDDQKRVNLLRNQELANPLQRFFVRSRNILPRTVRVICRVLKLPLFTRPVEAYPQSEKKQKEHLLSDIAYCKKQNCDLLIMCLHSGGQFNDEPTNYSEEISKFCRSNGVDLVVGNHEHLIQSIDPENEVAYCLGNFSSNYGIDRPPFDKNAECSVLLHIYFSGKDAIKFSFSVMLSKRENDCIVTVPLYDAYLKEKDVERKRVLVEKNTIAVNRFTKNAFQTVKPQEEYFLPVIPKGEC